MVSIDTVMEIFNEHIGKRYLHKGGTLYGLRKALEQLKEKE